MARGFQNLQPHLAQFERLAIVEGPESVVGLSAGAQTDRRTDPIPQFQMAGQKIRMKMCQKDIADVQTLALGVV